MTHMTNKKANMEIQKAENITERDNSKNILVWVIYFV